MRDESPRGLSSLFYSDEFFLVAFKRNAQLLLDSTNDPAAVPPRRTAES
ncbi:MAG TPA: hypothetical protein VF736_17625 [Pyrinomonadaceae bacterium]|jgi:hypothetical protein